LVRREAVAQPVTVIGGVGRQGLVRSDGARNVVGRAALMGLPGGQFERDRQAAGIGDGVDPGGQRTTLTP